MHGYVGAMYDLRRLLTQLLEQTTSSKSRLLHTALPRPVSQNKRYDSILPHTPSLLSVAHGCLLLTTLLFRL